VLFFIDLALDVQAAWEGDPAAPSLAAQTRLISCRFGA